MQQQQKRNITHSKQTKVCSENSGKHYTSDSLYALSTYSQAIRGWGRGEKKGKDLKALGRFSIMSFLSNTPIKASSNKWAPGEFEILNIHVASHHCMRQRGTRRHPGLLYSSSKARSKTLLIFVSPEPSQNYMLAKSIWI